MADTLRIKRRSAAGLAGAPTSLAAAEIAYNEKDDILYYGKGNSGGVATSVIPIAGPGFASGNYVSKTGDTMTNTLFINNPEIAWVGLGSIGAAGIWAYKGPASATEETTIRWGIALVDGLTETGGNAGSDFRIERYSDTGARLGESLVISRSTGLATVSANPTAPLGIATKQYVDSVTGGGAYLPLTGGTLTGPLAVEPPTGPAFFQLHALQAAQQTLISFAQSGTVKWQIGRNSDDTFILWDNAAATSAFAMASNGASFNFYRDLYVTGDLTIYKTTPPLLRIFSDLNHKFFAYNAAIAGAQQGGIGQGGYVQMSSGGVFSGTKSYTAFDSYNMLMSNESNKGFHFVRQAGGSTLTDGAFATLLRIDGNTGALTPGGDISIISNRLNFSYAGSSPAAGPAIRWTNGAYSPGTLGLYVSSGLAYQGDTPNPSFFVRAPTTDGTLGAVKVTLNGVTGDVKATGEIVTRNLIGIRQRNTTYSVLHYNDDTYYYLLTTAAGDPDGNFSTPRPLRINLANGDMYMQHTLTVGGHVYSAAGRLWGTNDFSAPLPLAGGQMTGKITTMQSVGGIGDAAGGQGAIEVQGATGNGAKMNFHHVGSFAAYFGLDSDNVWAVGGWSYGAVRHRVVHEGLSSVNLGSVTASYLSSNGNIDSGGGVYYYVHNGGIYSIWDGTRIGFTHTVGSPLYDGAGGAAARLKCTTGNGLTFGYSPGYVHMFIEDGLVKNFIIDHPTNPDSYLVHACLEGPEAAVFYRGKGVVVGQSVEVKLPDYFTELCDETTATVMVTPIVNAHDKPQSTRMMRTMRTAVNPLGATEHPPETIEAYATVAVAATEVKDGRFTVYVVGRISEEGEQEFHWRVEATRKDVPPVDVEPLKSEITVMGDGPYTYYKRN